MSEVNLVGSPRGLTNGGSRRCERYSEECQFESKPLATGRIEVAGDVPPLVAELRMRAGIAREFKHAWLERPCKAFRHLLPANDIEIRCRRSSGGQGGSQGN